MTEERTQFAARALAQGEVIGHFRIVRLLGQGGSGAIYEARNVHNEDERVALKIVLPDINDREMFFGLLRAEANALQRVKHEAVVQYRTFGRIPDSDEFYLVVEYVEGPTLARAIKDGPLSADKLQRLAIRLAEGLGAAHEQGVIHRDLSPDNIILVDGDPDRAAIIDFGIARNGAFDPLGTSFAGKFSYVAPEQLGGNPEQIGPWTDLYSLGLVLAAAARGRKIVLGNSLGSAIAARESVPDLEGVPPELTRALTALLQPDPALRVRTAEAAAALFTEKALRPQVVIRDPVSAPDMQAPDVSEPKRRRAFPLVIAAGLGVAALAATFAVTSGMFDGASAPEKPAAQTAVVASSSAPTAAPPEDAAPAASPSPTRAPTPPPVSQPTPAPVPPAATPTPAALPAVAPVLDPRIKDTVERAKAADAEATEFAETVSDEIAAAKRFAALAADAGRDAEGAATKARAAAKRACATRKPPSGYGCYKTQDDGQYAGEAKCQKSNCTGEGFGVITTPDGSLEGRVESGLFVLGCLYAGETRVYCGSLKDGRRDAGVLYPSPEMTQYVVMQPNGDEIGSAEPSNDTPQAGIVFTGTWRNGVMEGPGEVRGREDRVQVANFKGGKIIGSMFTLALDGSRFAAVFSSGQSPIGRITYRDGSIYAGEVWGDMKLGVQAEGLGALYAKDGAIIRQGRWRDGALVQDAARDELRVATPQRTLGDNAISPPDLALRTPLSFGSGLSVTGTGR